MTSKLKYFIYTALILSLGFAAVLPGFSQAPDSIAKGVVIESITGLPLQQAIISVASTGTTAITDENGNFSIIVPNFESELIIDRPGYNRRQMFLNGKKNINITLVPEEQKSFDSQINKTLGPKTFKDEIYPVSPLFADDVSLSSSTSFDHALQGMIPGLHVIRQSGLPGQKSFVNIRGFSSLFGRNEPLLIIDGMIQDYNYANFSTIEGNTLNPFDIVDIDDIADLSVSRTGDSYLGSVSSNGIIYLNTEQKSEASTLIKISGYAGISFEPRKLSVLSAGQYNDYFNSYLNQQGYSNQQIETMYPWTVGQGVDKYKYDNNTNWQNEIYQPGLLQKYHIFLKGGDDIATYNISAGLTNHDGPLVGTSFNRFNLRVNGRINISDKFSVTPNVKLSLSDTYTPNLGPTTEWNPIISSLLKPSIMSPNARDASNGLVLPYLEDVGNDILVSNPVSLVNNAIGNNRNYHFLSSINAVYRFNDKFRISNLLGINFNNARENIFLPDQGVVQIDSAANSPREFVYEFRSLQNVTNLTYTNKTSDGKSLEVNAGMRVLTNSYNHNIAIDLNTPSDDFKSLGHGSKYNYLRQSLGDNRGLSWVAYFANGDYSIKNKYFLNASVSVDASSALNDQNRYNVFPSVGGAWRLSSEEFMANSSIEDLKLRASWSLSGNMYSSVYDYSKLYYAERRFNSLGVLSREAIPNSNMEIEKTSTFNLGIDLSGKKQLTNFHADLYYAATNNLIIMQELPQVYGFTTYFDNGGKLANMGVELGIDHRKRIGEVLWTIGGTATSQISSVTDLSFINKEINSIVTQVEGAEFITSKGNAMNSFYGYKTNGIYKSDDEARQVIGPKGLPMKAGDVKFVDIDGNNIINQKDKQVIGNPNPLVFGGLFTSVKYQRWEVKTMLNYSVGNQAFNYVRYKAESMDTYASQLATVKDRWSNDNQNGKLPRASFGDPTGNSVFSDRWVEDASFLKIKQLTVNYSLPQSSFYNGINIYMTVTNLLTLTNYSGYDPEFFYLNDPFYMGIDYGKMPHPRSFIIGVKLSL